MTQSYVSFGGFDEEESLRTLDAAHAMGITFWDTADMYGPESNERLIGKWFQRSGKRKGTSSIVLIGSIRSKLSSSRHQISSWPPSLLTRTRTAS